MGRYSTSRSTIFHVLAFAIIALEPLAASANPQTSEYEQARTLRDKYTDVSVVALIANPRSYDGVYIRTSGFLSLNREDTALYIDESSYQGRVTSNAVWLERPKIVGDRYARYANGAHYATVQGIFKAKPIVNYPVYVGTILDVSPPVALQTISEHNEEASRRRFDSWLVKFPGIGVVLAIGGALALWLVRRGKR